MKPLPGATTRFTFFAISHKHTAHNGSIFLPFVTLSFSTFCGSDSLPCAVCASHTRFHPAFLACSKAQNSLPASLAQQPSCTGVLGVMWSRGQGQVGTLQACPDPQLLCVATSSPQPICWEQGAECPPFSSGSELSATGVWQHQPALKWRGWVHGCCLHLCGEKEQAQTCPAEAQIQHWGLGCGRAAGLLPSPRTLSPRVLCAGPVLYCIIMYSLWKGFNITALLITEPEKQEKTKQKQTLTV